MVNFAQIRRLATREDPVFTHKVLGCLTLGHIGYRMILIFKYGDSGLATDVWTPFWVVLHALLRKHVAAVGTGSCLRLEKESPFTFRGRRSESILVPAAIAYLVPVHLFAVYHGERCDRLRPLAVLALLLDEGAAHSNAQIDRLR